MTFASYFEVRDPAPLGGRLRFASVYQAEAEAHARKVYEKSHVIVEMYEVAIVAKEAAA